MGTAVLQPIASVALWVGAIAAVTGATALAWRLRAVAGVLAGAIGAGAIASGAVGVATTAGALTFAGLFAAISLGATAVGATAGRLLDDEDREDPW